MTAFIALATADRVEVVTDTAIVNPIDGKLICLHPKVFTAPSGRFVVFGAGLWDTLARIGEFLTRWGDFDTFDEMVARLPALLADPDWRPDP